MRDSAVAVTKSTTETKQSVSELLAYRRPHVHDLVRYFLGTLLLHLQPSSLMLASWPIFKVTSDCNCNSYNELANDNRFGYSVIAMMRSNFRLGRFSVVRVVPAPRRLPAARQRYSLIG
jgi:hypothetical protein